MKWRMVVAVVILLAIGALVPAGQPGERAKGREFKSDAFTLVWGKLKASSDVDLSDEKKSKYGFQLDGSMDVPADQDVVAVLKRFAVRSMADDKGGEITAKAITTAGGSAPIYNAIHENVGQVEVPRLEISRDPSRIATIVLDSEIVIAKERAGAKLPAVVMEDFKDIGQGISIRITSLQMSTSREFTVILNYKRGDAGTDGPFIEKIFAVDPDGKDLGGGRWTEGTPFGKAGVWTAKFKLSGAQKHQSVRFELVTKSEAKKLSFEIKDLFNRP